VLRGRQAEPSDAHAEHLPVVPQVPGDEDDEEDLGELARLESHRPDRDPEVRAVDRLAELRQRGQDQEPNGEDPERVLVVVEPPVPVAGEQHREREDADADYDPDALAERQIRVDPVDERQSGCSEQAD
jgi:hypothetical protein